MARECFECLATIYAGEGGVRAFGKLFCSEDCADVFEHDIRELPQYSESYGEHPLGGAW